MPKMSVIENLKRRGCLTFIIINLKLVLIASSKSWPLTAALAVQIPPMKIFPCTLDASTCRTTQPISGVQTVEEKIGKQKTSIIPKLGTQT